MSDAATSQITELLATLRGACAKARALAETRGGINLILTVQNVGSAVEELESALECALQDALEIQGDA